jgi:predicted nucleic acid-binding protein
MLLDTNAYSALARGIPAAIEVISSAQELNLPLPVIAELRYGLQRVPSLSITNNNYKDFFRNHRCRS